MKICIIGNSHLSCVKKAWDNYSTYYAKLGYEVTFFGSHADTLLNTESSERGVFPLTEQVGNSFYLTSDGEREISFDKYDLFVLHGLSPSLRNYLSLYKYFKNRFSSKSFQEEAFFNIGSTMDFFIKHLIKSGKKIIVTPRPCASFSDISDIDENLKITDDVFYKLIDYIKSGFSKRNLFYLHQPSETLLYNFLTKKEFNENGMGLGAVPIKDNSKFLSDRNVTHMNEIYGRHYLDNLFKNLSDCT